MTQILVHRSFRFAQLSAAGLLVVAGVAACSASPSSGSPSQGGPDGGAANDGGPTAKPGQLALAVQTARRGVKNSVKQQLEVRLQIANGSGGNKASLSPARFSVSDSSGVSVRASAGGQAQFVDGEACSASAELNGGGSATCVLTFAISGTSEPKEIRYEGEGLANIESTADKRTASAPVSVEACTTCGTSCTYLDVDENNCGQCGLSLQSSAKCTDGESSEGPACYADASLPLSGGSGPAYADVANGVGYHQPLAKRTGCSAQEAASIDAGAQQGKIHTLQQLEWNPNVVAISDSCASCVTAEYNTASNPAGASNKWGPSGFRYDTRSGQKTFPSNLSLVNPYGCLQNRGVLNAEEARKGYERDTCLAIACPAQGDGACSSQTEYDRCLGYAKKNACKAPNDAFVAANIEAKSNASGECQTVASIVSAFCGN